MKHFDECRSTAEKKQDWTDGEDCWLPSVPEDIGKKAGAIECLVHKTERLADEAQKLEERLLLAAKVHFGLDSVNGEEQKEKYESSMDKINSNLTHISKLFYKLDDLLKEM
jgi:hypothetical protein